MPLRLLDLKPGAIPATRAVPHIFLPLVEAAKQGKELVPVVRAIVEGLGFDSFAYALSTEPSPRQGRSAFHLHDDAGRVDGALRSKGLRRGRPARPTRL